MPQTHQTQTLTMKTLITIPTLLCAAAALSGVSPEPHYATHEVHQTTFSVESSSTLVEMTALMNGEEGPGMPDMEREDAYSLAGQFRDTITRVDEDELAAFDRDYEQLERATSSRMSDPMMGDLDESSEEESPLDELSVHFTRGEQGFVPSFPEDSSEDEELLEGLTGPLPFAALLPDGAVDPGDEWELPASAIWDFIEPGGDLSFRDPAVQEDLPEGIMKVDASNFPAELDGDTTASLVEVKELDGVRHAVISLTIEITRFQDLTDMMGAQETGSPEDLPEGAVIPDIDSLEVEQSLEGEGTLLWNLEEGVATSLEISLDSARTEIMRLSIDMGTEAVEIEQTSVFEGELSASYDVKVERG